MKEQSSSEEIVEMPSVRVVEELVRRRMLEEMEPKTREIFLALQSINILDRKIREEVDPRYRRTLAYLAKAREGV